MISTIFSSAVLLALVSSSLALPAKRATPAPGSVVSTGSGAPLGLAGSAGTASTLSTTGTTGAIDASDDDLASYRFTKSIHWDFTTLQALPSGLSVSLDKIAAGDAPFSQQYTTSDVYVQNGALNLRVPGGQKGPVIQGAQVATTDKLLYGSVRTTAKVSSVAGTCHGFFSYNNNNLEETDIEILTANLTSGVHYTNQKPSFYPASSPRSATTTRALPDDATTTFHEYRTDWLPGKVRWYLDGVFQAELDTYAPTAPVPWLWNNWSNGDDGWSAGPPAANSVLEVRKIEMRYNSTS